MTALAHKIVLITGGGGGLGRALAGAFARQGCRVVIAGRDAGRLTAAAQEIDAAGGTVLAWACDVGRKSQVEAMAQHVGNNLGPVEVLVNNAGIARAAAFLDMPDNLWDETLQTNLTAACYCCQAFLPGMIKIGWGRIISIASTAAKVGYPYVSAYASSKHGLLGLTRSLALETARLGVTVNAICPGYIDGELTRENARRMAQKTGRSTDEILTLLADHAPQKRLIQPDEIAGLALMLASDQAGGITGQAINIDGGAVMA